MRFDFKKILPHILVVIGFIVVALIYFKPIMNGEVLQQSDVSQYKAMSRELRDFHKQHKERTYWIDNAFGGMPTYIISKGNLPQTFLDTISSTINFLPNPANYLFLYLIGLYILLLVLKVDYKLAAIGALAFGFSTYMIIILGVGHLTKAHAIAFMPIVIAGILAVFRKKYIWGGILLALSLGMELYSAHYQIVYYTLYIAIIIGLVYLYEALKEKKLLDFSKAIGVMVIAALLAVGANITGVLATQQYTQWSTRGDSGLTISADDSKSNAKPGMSYDYIMQYSYGIGETMDLFIPRFMGGASTETLGADSHAYKALQNVGVAPAQAERFLKNAPTYWGDQPIVAAPAYIGAVIIFLFILALFLIGGRFKKWVVIACILAIALSWGKNFGILAHFFVDYIPLYDKFRTVSMIQVIPELLLPVFGIFGLQKLFSEKIETGKKLHALKWATIITAGVCIFFLLTKTWLFNFTGLYDAQLKQNVGANFIKALKQDRIDMLNSDTIRSLIFVLLSAITIFAFLKEKINKKWVIGIFTILILVDLIGIDNNYVNYDSFSPKVSGQGTFQPNSADLAIMEDTTHYRVLDLSGNPMNSSRASYFHNSIGGYSAAKPGRYQELYDFYISKGNRQVLNMLNTKYFIVSQQGKPVAQRNTEAYGNAWFVDSVIFVPSVNEEMRTLGEINPRHTAVINEKFKDLIPRTSFNTDSSDTISLTHYQANKVVYSYKTKEDRLAIFSEIYYPHGWQIDIDGQNVEMAQANYVLRAVYLPKGQHTITFKFKPAIIKEGNIISAVSGIIIALAIIGGIFINFRKKKEEEEKEA